MKELERAIVEYGLKGVLINSSHQGAYPDDDEAKPFFELVTSLGIPVMMHAPSVGFGEERMSDYRLASSVGRPFDECLAIARMIVRGVFEQLPKLKFVGCHLGGGICEVIGRMDYAYELGEGLRLGTLRADADHQAAERLFGTLQWTPSPIIRRRSCAPTKPSAPNSCFSAATRHRCCRSCRAPRKSSKSYRSPRRARGYLRPQRAEALQR